MPVYSDPAIDEIVKIDANHAEFVRSLVTCAKPHRVLELGFGAGESTRAILSGLRYNMQAFDYTVVDNWFDFQGIIPEATNSPEYAEIRFITSAEHEFVDMFLQGGMQRYDFIFSDADHCNTQLWFHQVYEHMLAPGGILLYHDVTNTESFPNLMQIYEAVVRNNYRHLLFNRNSRQDERCDRGLLAIFKD